LIERKSRAPTIEQVKTEQARYQATGPEREALKAQIERLNAGRPTPRIKIEGAGKHRIISLDHPNEDIAAGLFKEAFGTANLDFANALLTQLLQSQSGNLDVGELNFILAVIAGIKPNDQLEAMFGAQMAVVHLATMKSRQKLDRAENPDQQDSAERAFNKLVRTFAVQMETLKRYRTGGEQKDTVQHVSVSDGSQAIVGNVTHAPREDSSGKRAHKTPALNDTRHPAMPVLEEESERTLVPLRRRQKDVE
jgi:hypothetical protein